MKLKTLSTFAVAPLMGAFMTTVANAQVDMNLDALPSEDQARLAGFGQCVEEAQKNTAINIQGNPTEAQALEAEREVYFLIVENCAKANDLEFSRGENPDQFVINFKDHTI